jgi:hypothetical protein
MTRRSSFSVELPPGALTVASPEPALVSQHTSEHQLGIPRRQFLSSARAFAASGGEVIVLGRLRLVAMPEYLAWLRERRELTTQADDLASLADEMGLRLLGGDA